MKLNHQQLKSLARQSASLSVLVAVIILNSCSRLKSNIANDAPMELSTAHFYFFTYQGQNDILKIDQFDSTSLGLEWISMNSFANNLYSLKSAPNFLSLKCGSMATTKEPPSLICRKIEHLQFECTTKMNFNPVDENESAGLLLNKDETHQYYVGIQHVGGKRKLFLQKIGEKSSPMITVKYLDDLHQPIFIKVSSTGEFFNFYYALKDNEWMSLSMGVDASYLSTANSYGFTGTTIGMYAQKKFE